MLVTEGIGQTRLDDAAEESEFETKKFLKNYLLKRGIKIDEKKSMEKSTASAFSRSGPKHKVDLLDGYTFYTHHKHLEWPFAIKVSITASKMRAELEWMNSKELYEKQRRSSTVEDFGEFIVESWKDFKSKTEKTTSADLESAQKGLSKKIEEITPSGWSSKVVTSYDDTVKIELGLSLGKSRTIDPNKHALPGKRKLIDLLDDPVVKRNLPSHHKKIRQDDFLNFQHFQYAYKDKEKVFEDLESFIEGLYEKESKVTQIRWSYVSPDLVFVLEKPLDQTKNKRKQQQKVLTKKQATRKAKRKILEIVAQMKKADEELIEIAESVGHVIIKRLFKIEGKKP